MGYPPKGKADYLAEGDWNAVCYECGRKFKASTMKKNWMGFYVCEEDWWPRQPQDFAKGVPDIQTPPWVQPMPPDQFVSMCDPNGISAVPGAAEPGCVIPGYLSPAYNPEGAPNA